MVIVTQFRKRLRLRNLRPRPRLRLVDDNFSRTASLPDPIFPVADGERRLSVEFRTHRVTERFWFQPGKFVATQLILTCLGYRNAIPYHRRVSWLSNHLGEVAALGAASCWAVV